MKKANLLFAWILVLILCTSNLFVHLVKGQNMSSSLPLPEVKPTSDELSLAKGQFSTVQPRSSRLDSSGITDENREVEFFYIPTNIGEDQVKSSFSGGQPATAVVTVISDGGSGDQKVESFTLIEALNDVEVAVHNPLNEGDKINIVNLAELDIRANTDPEQVGSVHFKLAGPIQWEMVENSMPYALFGDDKGDYRGMEFPLGKYTLTAIPYTQKDAKGQAGIPLQVSFEVVEGQELISFTLIDANMDKEIATYDPIKEGDLINLVSLPEQLNIRANAGMGPVGSVWFKLEGPKQWEMVENSMPYALFGDDKGDYRGMEFPLGKYTLTAIPYTQKDAKGQAGIPLQVSFEVVDESMARIQSLSKTRIGNDNLEAVHTSAYASEEIIAYPVPFDNQFYLKSSQAKDLQLSLIDLTGKEHKINDIFQGNNIAINIADLNLPTGLYLLKIQTVGGSIKLLKVQKN